MEYEAPIQLPHSHPCVSAFLVQIAAPAKIDRIDIRSTIPGIIESETLVKRKITEKKKKATKVKRKLKARPLKTLIYILIPP